MWRGGIGREKLVQGSSGPSQGRVLTSGREEPRREEPRREEPRREEPRREARTGDPSQNTLQRGGSSLQRK